MSLKKLMSREVFRFKNLLPTSSEPKKRKQHTNSVTHRYFDMPEHYYNSYYFANATINDNLLWYVGNTLEQCFQLMVKNYSKKYGLQKEDIIDKEIKNLFKSLEFCKSIFEVHYPVRKKNEDYEIIRAFCMHHGHFYSTHFGGLYKFFHNDVFRTSLGHSSEYRRKWTPN